jgi:hypothetical protein
MPIGMPFPMVTGRRAKWLRLTSGIRQAMSAAFSSRLVKKVFSGRPIQGEPAKWCSSRRHDPDDCCWHASADWVGYVKSGHGHVRWWTVANHPLGWCALVIRSPADEVGQALGSRAGVCATPPGHVCVWSSRGGKSGLTGGVGRSADGLGLPGRAFHGRGR